MKTNQMMQVNLGSFGSVVIGHKTGLGKVADIVTIGNNIRKGKGLRTYTQHEMLRSTDLWEYIFAQYSILYPNSKYGESAQLKPINSNSSVTLALKDYIDNKGQVQYTKLMKMFPELIMSKRGKYGGTWASVEVLLKVATKLDKHLEAIIYNTFINGQILHYRNAGGLSFKLLNTAIDTLADRTPQLKPKGNKGCYIQVAKQLRDKLAIIGKGYNDADHDSKVQLARDKLEQQLVMLINAGYVTTYSELKDAITKV